MKKRYLGVPIWLYVLVILSLAIASYAYLIQPPLHNYYGLADNSPYELISQRTRTSKTFYDPSTNTYITDIDQSSIHYKDDPDDPNEQWKDIETDIVPSDRPNWDWEVVKGNWHLLIKDDTTVALGKDGSWIGFQYQGFAYYDYSTKQYQILADRNDITPIVSGNKIHWDDIFFGCNLEYVYGPDGFKENLEITQLARNWCAAHPPSSYGLNNDTTYITGYLLCDWQNSFPAENSLGDPINFDNYESDASAIFWRNPVKDKIVTALPVGYAISPDLEPDEWIKLHHRFFKYNDNNYLLFGAKVTDLNQYPAGTIIIDPTIDEQVDAGADDAYESEGGYFDYTSTANYIYADTGGARLWGAARWEGISGIKGNTIDTMYAEIYIYDTTWDDMDCHVYAEDVDDPDDFTETGDIWERTKTSASVSWEGDSLGTGWKTSPELKTIGQEIADRGGLQDAILLIFAGDDDADKDLSYMAQEGGGGAYAPKLHIEYTAGGVSAPTVVTANATLVEETTATLQGNITAAGGENCTRGFRWDIDSGAPYANSWDDTGTHGTGNFTHGLTGLTKGELYYYIATANNTGGTGNGSEVTFLTKPDPAASFTSTDNGTTWISLSWSNGTGMDYVEVRYAEGSAPSDNTSGTLGYWGNGTSANVSGLSTATTYHFRIFTHATEGGLWSIADNNPECQDTTDSAISVPTLVTGNATSISYTSAIGQGNITATGGQNATERGFQYGIGDFSANVSEAGSFSTGNFSLSITGLTDNTEYQYRAYAINGAGIGYGASVNFTTLDIVVPTVVTGNATSVSYTSATGQGNIIATGGANATERGFQYGIGSFSDNVSENGDYSTGNFSLSMSSLSDNTEYQYRAYAINLAGIAYGATVNFTTLEIVAPTVTTANASNIGDTYATLGGSITDTGGENADTRAVQWGLASGNYTANQTSSGSYGTGSFSFSATSLSANTTYYFRAGAHNANGGWGWGSEKYFTTSAEIPNPPEPPEDFSIIDLGGIVVTANWSASANASGYLLLVSRSDYPSSANGTVFELCYDGILTTVNLSGYSLNNTTYYWSLWAYNGNGYSTTYSTATAGNGGDFITEDDMETLATSIDNFLPLLLVVAIVGIAFWQDRWFLFLIASPASFIYGLTLAASADTDRGLWAAGTIFAVIGMYCLYKPVTEAVQGIIRRRKE